MTFNADGGMTIDAGHEIPVYSRVCSLCKHFTGKRGGERTCTAFPDAIPMRIWMGENHHTHPYPGDHGIQFEYVRAK